MFDGMKPVLQTERLYFRTFTQDDALLLYKMHQDPAITKYTGDPIPWDSVERVQAILRDVILPQYEHHIGRWAVHLKGDDTFIGWCGLRKVEDEVDLGYRFIQQFWGKGYATEAAKAVLNYGLTRGIQNIIGCTSVHNYASIKVLSKIGLVFQEKYYNGTVESAKFVWEPAGLRNIK